MDDIDLLRTLHIFSSLTEGELDAVASLLEPSQPAAGEVIFKEGDVAGGLYIVSSGRVVVKTRVSVDVEKTLLTLRSGDVFGELSLITGEGRTATAIAEENTELLRLTPAQFDTVVQDSPVIGTKLMKYLLTTLANRLNVTTSLYRKAVSWNLDISGIIELHYHQLIVDQAEVTMELTTGNAVTGTLLKLEHGENGAEFVLKTADENFAVVPYHAVATVAFTHSQETETSGAANG